MAPIALKTHLASPPRGVSLSGPPMQAPTATLLCISPALAALAGDPSPRSPRPLASQVLGCGPFPAAVSWGGGGQDG